MSKFGMLARVVLLSLGALSLMLFSAANNRADGVTFDSPTDDLGSSMFTYMLDGVPIAAAAF
jgi:hypothetical protein